MGIESRDYYRESSRYSGSDGWSPASVCKRLIIANIVVFVLQIFLVRQPRPEDYRALLERRQPGVGDVEDDQFLTRLDLPKISVVEEWLRLETGKVIRRAQVWRLVTYAFCHDRFGVFHIVFNMLFLYWFGKTLEAMYGAREFLLFYLTAAVIAGLAYLGLGLVTGDAAPAIGASGAVMAVTMLYAIHYPRERIYLFFFIPIEVRWLVLLYVIFDLHPVLLALAGDRLSTGVAHAAHLGGLAFGFLYWKYGFRLEPLLHRFRMPRLDRLRAPRRHLTVYQPPQDDLDGQVDEILRKIHQHGEASLTDQERETLKAASQRYRRRTRPEE